MKKKILLISPETYPTVKVGGLGKVTDSLGRNLAKFGVEIKIISADRNIYGFLNRKRTELDNRELGKKAALMCQKNNWQPDWVWSHDWGGIWSVDEFKKYQQKVMTMWTVHSPINLTSYGYEGGYGYGYEGYGGYSSGDEAIDWGDDFFSFSELVSQGCNQADVVTTVSKNYATTLNKSQMFINKGVEGVNLGINLDVWNPSKDGLLLKRLNDGDWSTFKTVNKRKLQQSFGLPVKELAVFCFVSRMVAQKGMDLLIRVLPGFLARNDVQVVMVGQARGEYVEKLKRIKNQFGNKLGLKLEADFDIPHLVYAGADFLMLPSIEEPFGLVVAEAKRYGVVPIVSETGGLVDQVKNGIDGISFGKYDPDVFINKLVEAKTGWQTGFWQKKYDLLSGGVRGEVEMTKEFLSLLYAK